MDSVYWWGRRILFCCPLWIILLLVLGLNWQSNSHDRDKATDISRARPIRQTDEVYTVELFMVVDYAAYKWWYGLTREDTDRETEALAAINQYYSYVFNGIDLRFRSIEDQTFKIDVALVGIYVAKSENESEWTSGSTVDDGGQVKGERLMVNSSEALEKFQNWIDENENLPTFDHAVLFTGTNLTYAGSPGNTGLAFASSMCRNISNSSIVEDTFDFRTINYAAQQIARSLGASDDMDNNDCLEFFNYIMTPKLKLPMKSFPSNRWTYSSCSVAYFKEYLDTLNEDQMNCLLDTSITEKYPPTLAALVEQLPGKTYDADQQCAHAYGFGSFVCRTEIKDKYDSVCYGLPCYEPDKESCKMILPADGTPCGNRKYCLKGKCSTFKDAETRLDTCPYGNSPNADCSGVSLKPSVCYLTNVLYDCCDSCLNVSSPRKGCEFGDRISSCTVDDCLIRGGQYSAVTCCFTCENITAPDASPTAPNITSSLLPTESSKSDVTDLPRTITTSKGLEGDFLQTPSDKPLTLKTSATTYSTSLGLPGSTSADGVETKGLETTLFYKDLTAQSTRMVSVSNEALPVATKVKRSSPMIFTKTILQTAEPVKAPATVKPALYGHQGYFRYDSSSTADIKIGSYITTQGSLDIASKAYDTSRMTPGDTSMTIQSTVETTTPAVFSQLLSVKVTTKEAVVMTSSAITQVPEKVNTQTGVAVTPYIPTTIQASGSQVRGTPSTTPCPTVPIKNWDKNLSLLNKQFFSKLAIAMKSKQRLVLYAAYAKLQEMYKEVTRIYKERQDADMLMTSSPKSPSFVNSDILRMIGPVWREELRELLITLYSNIKKLRYRILTLTKGYITRQTEK